MDARMETKTTATIISIIVKPAACRCGREDGFDFMRWYPAVEWTWIAHVAKPACGMHDRTNGHNRGSGVLKSEVVGTSRHASVQRRMCLQLSRAAHRGGAT